MTPDELTELEALERAATEGPLTVAYDGPSRPIIMNPQWEWLSFSRLEDGHWGSYSKEDADCYLYAALRNAAPRLFAALREAWKLGSAWQKVAEDCIAERDALRADNTALAAKLEAARGLLREARANLPNDCFGFDLPNRIDAALEGTLIKSREVISKPGAAIRVEKLTLTQEANDGLTLDAALGVKP